MRTLPVVCLLAAALAAEDDPVAALMKQLADPDRAARAKAARALGRADDARVPPALKAALEDKEETVRIAAAAALARLKAPDARVVDVLAAGLRSPGWYDRWEACLALGAIGPRAEAAVPALVKAARDRALDISHEAVRALGAVGPGDERALKGLASLLDDADPKGRDFILGLLERANRCDLAATWLAGEMRLAYASDVPPGRRDPKREVRVRELEARRSRATALLMKAGPAGVLALLECAKDEDPWVRAVSIGALGTLEVKEAGELALAAATDPDIQVRRAAIGTIGRIKPEGGARVATAALADSDLGVRISAACALGELNVEDKAAGPGLVHVFGDCLSIRDMRPIFEATGFRGLAAFATIDWRKTTPVVRLRLRAETPEEIAALDALVAEIEDKEHGEALVAALRETLGQKQDDLFLHDLAEGGAPLRRTAAILLGHLAQEPAPCIEALEKARKDEDQAVSTAASAAIERLQSRN